MRHLLLVAVVLTFAVGDAQGKKRRRSRGPVYEAGQTCTLKKPVKVYTKAKKKLTLMKGVKITLLKVGKQWVTVRSDKSIEGSVKLNKALAKACKPVAGTETPAPAKEAPPTPEPEPPASAEVEPMPEPPPDVEKGGEMEIPERRETPGIQMPAKDPEKVKPFSALDVLGAEGVRSFAVERRSARQSTSDLLGWGAIGIGGAGLISCGVLIGVSSGKASELAEDIEIYNERAVRTSETARELEDRKGTVAALDAGAIAAGAVGLVAVGAGLYLLLFGEDSAYASTWVAPDQGVGVVLGGRF